jgi:hypothetical protein
VAFAGTAGVKIGASALVLACNSGVGFARVTKTVNYIGVGDTASGRYSMDQLVEFRVNCMRDHNLNMVPGGSFWAAPLRATAEPPPQL